MGQQKSSSTDKGPESSSTADTTTSKGFFKPWGRTMTTETDKEQVAAHEEICAEDADDILNNNKPSAKEYEKAYEPSPTSKSRTRSRRAFSPVSFLQSAWSRLFSPKKKGRKPNRETLEKGNSPTSRIMRHNRKSLQSISRPTSPEILSIQNIDAMSDRSLTSLRRQSGNTMLSTSRGQFHQILEVNMAKIQNNRSNKRKPPLKVIESRSQTLWVDSDSDSKGSSNPSLSSNTGFHKKWTGTGTETGTGTGIDQNNSSSKGSVEPGPSQQRTGQKREVYTPPKRRERDVYPSRCCGPSAPPVYLDYRLSSNRQGCGNRTGNPIMDKLKNVDVIEELNYYPPAETGCGDADSDDKEYYYMCNDCGELEPAPDSEKPKGSKKIQSTKPVTYSRRQRFNFKTSTNPDDDDDGPPFKWPGSKGSHCRCPCCLAGLRRDPKCCCKCCCCKGRDRVLNSYDEIPVGKNPLPEPKPSEPTITSTDSEEEECEKLIPKQSGVYFYDADEKRFIRQVPRTPTPIAVKIGSESNLEEESELEQGIPRHVEDIIKSLPPKQRTITMPVIQAEHADMQALLGNAGFMLHEDEERSQLEHRVISSTNSQPLKLDNNNNKINRQSYKQEKSLPITYSDYKHSTATTHSSYSPKDDSRTRRTTNDTDSTDGTGSFEAIGD